MERFNFSVISVIILISMTSHVKCISSGYSFSKFMGPVSGVEEKIPIYDEAGHYHTHDYVAKPDYHFEYGVQDPKSMVHQSRHETREGDVVHGEYSVLDPDGKLRTVKYTADKKNGFHASIHRDGHVIHHPQDPVQPNYDQNTAGIPQNGDGGDGGGGGDEYDGDEGDDGNGGNGDEYSNSASDSGGDGDDDEESDEYY